MKAQLQTPYTVRIEKEILTGENVTFLLLSDIHWDNPHCRRDLLTEHLDEAKERDAGILIFGDLFCAMQGKYDPRGSKAGIRPEHNVPNYLDAIVNDAAAFFMPYKDNLLLVTPGNHETSILKRQETDITGRFCQAVGCLTAAYAGWVRISVQRSNKVRRLITLAYHHGYGGGGPVTKDVIQASRKAVYLPDAEVIVSGHTHDRNIFPVARVHLQQSGRQVISEQIHCKLGTYKDEYTDGNGWAIEKGMPPKPLGGVWMNIEHKRKGSEENFKIKIELA